MFLIHYNLLYMSSVYCDHTTAYDRETLYNHLSVYASNFDNFLTLDLKTKVFIP